ncbi:MAG: hypothetical protein ACI4BD_09025 [Paludibacteraceae bacterium]
MTRRFSAVIIATALLLTACHQQSAPAKPVSVASEFTSCYAECYGQAYDSVPLNVLALDLYSDGLCLNEQNKIEGSGTNLYISDIFLTAAMQDSLLSVFDNPDGLESIGQSTVTFRSDSLPSPCTFLPGMNFEGNPTGIYILTIADNAIAGIQVLDSGTFTLTHVLQSDSLPADALPTVEFHGTFYYSTRSSANAKPVVHTYSAHSTARWQVKKQVSL